MARPADGRNTAKTRSDAKDSKAKVGKSKAKQKGDFARTALQAGGKKLTALKAEASAQLVKQKKLEMQRSKLEAVLAGIEKQQEAEWKLGLRILRKLELAQKELAKEALISIPGGKPLNQPSYVARADALLVMIVMALTLIAKKLR